MPCRGAQRPGERGRALHAGLQMWRGPGLGGIPWAAPSSPTDEPGQPSRPPSGTIQDGDGVVAALFLVNRVSERLFATI